MRCASVRSVFFALVLCRPADSNHDDFAPTSASLLRRGASAGRSSNGLKQLIAGLIAALPFQAAAAAETVTFRYDALGRLIESTTAGGVTSGLTLGYSLDKADNRTAKTVANGAGTIAPDVGAMILPLNGFTVVPVLSTP